MKKFTLYFLFLCAFLVLSQSVSAQKSEATAKAAELTSQGRFKEAIAVLDKAAQNNQDLYQIYKMRASLKRMTGDFAGALNDLSLAIEQKSDDGFLYEERAMMRFYTRGDAALILADLDAAISYGRKYEKVYTTRAMIRMQTRDFDGAVADYETAIGLRPDLAGSYIGLSAVYGIQGNEEKAAEVLEKFITALENSDSKFKPVRSEVLASSGANQVPNISGKKDVLVQEGAVIIGGIKGKSTTGSSISTNGSSFSAEEMQAQTERLEQTKNIAGVYASLASIYVRREDYEKASTLVEKSLSYDPSDYGALAVRGKIRTARGDYPGAIADYDAAIKLMPNIPPNYLERGIAKTLAGNEAEAQKDFDKYLQLFPGGKAFLDRELAKAKEKMQK